MKTIFDNLEENLSVAIELLSHTLEQVKEKTQALNDSPVATKILADLSPEKLEMIIEKEEKPEDKTQLEKDIDEWINYRKNDKPISIAQYLSTSDDNIIKIGNGFFVCKDIKAIELSQSKKSAVIYLNDSRSVIVYCWTLTIP